MGDPNYLPVMIAGMKWRQKGGGKVFEALKFEEAIRKVVPTNSQFVLSAEFPARSHLQLFRVFAIKNACQSYRQAFSCVFNS